MISRAFTAKFIPREDGGLRVCSEDLPGLILSHNEPAKIMGELLEVAEVLMQHNDGRGWRRDLVSIDRADLIALKQLVSIVEDINEAKETMPLLRRINAALSATDS